jgi:dipeptidyl aminopeptidase/acylaminoacyl peptidase
MPVRSPSGDRGAARHGRWAPGRRRWLPRGLALGGAAGLVLANALAYRQARAMLRFAARGPRTPAPEALTAAGRLGAVLRGVTVPRPANRRSPAAVGLAFETRAVPVEPGLALEAWVIPPGVRGGSDRAGVALLFHGYADCKDGLLEAAQAFCGLGYVAVLVDFRGSGGSGGDRTTLGYAEARDVAATGRWALTELGEAAPVLYGVSMGAAAVLRAVAFGSVRPRAVVLEAPFDRLLTAVRRRVRAMRLPASPAAELLLLWGSVQAGFNGFAHNPAEYAARAACPALLVCGQADPRVTPADARAVYDRLPGPKRLVVVPGVGHSVAGTVPPPHWRGLVRDFLESTGSAPP